MLSTLTSDVSTVQDFASSATLSIVVDVMTTIGILGIMFYLEWDFALIAVGVTPFLLLFVMRFKKAVKDATREVRKRQSDIVGMVEQGLGSMRAVKAGATPTAASGLRISSIAPGTRYGCRTNATRMR
jgi:ABC-type multidrug transport system fused ATPase/permease subunit